MGMYAEDLNRRERNSYQMQHCFYTILAKRPNICFWGVQIWKKEVTADCSCTVGIVKWATRDPTYTEGTALMWEMCTQAVQNYFPLTWKGRIGGVGVVAGQSKEKKFHWMDNLKEFTIHECSVSEPFSWHFCHQNHHNPNKAVKWMSVWQCYQKLQIDHVEIILSKHLTMTYKDFMILASPIRWRQGWETSLITDKKPGLTQLVTSDYNCTGIQTVELEEATHMLAPPWRFAVGRVP